VLFFFTGGSLPDILSFQKSAKPANFRSSIVLLRIASCFFFLSIFVSCGLKNRYVYFYNQTENLKSQTNASDVIIKQGDKLEVKIAGLEPQSSLPFYFSSGSNSPISNSESPPNVFQVNDQGEIDMPVLGKITLQGLSLSAAELVLKEKLQGLIRVPVVQIRISNFMVTVLGEVKAPGYYKIPNNRINILELLAMAGDLTSTSNRQEIMVIRKAGENEEVIMMDLTSNSLFSSPGFQLKQNDVVYIRPNNTGLLQPTLFRSIGPLTLSAISIIFSTLVIILRL
jgi:polysaccharide export outer membrane protein